jgi:hypothetical protein
MPGMRPLPAQSLDLTKMYKLTSVPDLLTDLSWLASLHHMFKRPS